MRIVVVGGGIAGLAAARRLERLVERVDVILLEATGRVGGKLLTEEVDGFIVEGAADSFLSRKERGIELCEEIGLADELVGRRPENACSFVRIGSELHVLPEGLSGLIPTNLDALDDTTLLSSEGKERLAAEFDLPPAPEDGDESIASFVSRRLGREAYERIVEPLTAGIYGGDGEQLSLQATFPQLRSLELEHGSVLRGLAGHAPAELRYPPFVSFRSGMGTLVDRLVATLEHTAVHASRAGTVNEHSDGYVVDVGHAVETDAVVVAAPADSASSLLAELDPVLAGVLAEIPYSDSAIVTLGYRLEDVPHPLAGYGYVVPASEGSDVLACTWSSSKWEGRTPVGHALIRVYLRRIPTGPDDRFVDLAREELLLLGIGAEPVLARVHRWPRGMPQYVLGHPERLGRIDALVAGHPGLALAGAAYRGVGIPDCIDSGEQAAESVVRALTGARA